MSPAPRLILIGMVRSFLAAKRAKMLEYFCKILLIWFVLGGVAWAVFLFKEKKRRGHFPLVRLIDFLIYFPLWPMIVLVMIFGPCNGPSTDKK
jgi:hypothetical protein